MTIQMYFTQRSILSIDGYVRVCFYAIINLFSTGNISLWKGKQICR